MRPIASSISIDSTARAVVWRENYSDGFFNRDHFVRFTPGFADSAQKGKKIIVRRGRGRRKEFEF